MNDDNERANDDDEMKPNKQHKNYKLSRAYVLLLRDLSVSTLFNSHNTYHQKEMKPDTNIIILLFFLKIL